MQGVSADGMFHMQQPGVVSMANVDQGVKKSRLGRGLSSLIGEPVKLVSPNSGGISVNTHATASAPSGASVDARGGLVMVGVGEIGPSRNQPRRVFDEAALLRLTASIQRSGMMQPVVLRAMPEDAGGVRYELVAGERRWRAAKMAGLTTVPAVVRDLSDEESAEWGLVENVQREDLNPIEKAWAFRMLVEKYYLSHGDIAQRVGLDRSSVANCIRLTDLEEPIRALIAAGTLREGHGKALLSAPPGESRIALANKAGAEHWTVRQTERAALELVVKLTDARVKESRAISDRIAAVRGLSPAMAARLDLEKQLSEHLGTKVAITTDRKGESGKLTIEFYGLDHFDGLVGKMGFRAR